MTPAPDVRTARGTSTSRLRRSRLLLFFGLALGVLLATALASAALLAPPPPGPICPRHQKVCGKPPRAPRLAPRLVNNAEFDSPGLGFRLEYPARLIEIAHQDSSELALRLIPRYGDDLSLVIESSAGLGLTPSQLLDRRLEDVRQTTLGLTPNSDPANALLGPEVGYRSGVGGVYSGTLDSPTGVSGQVEVLAMAAADGRTTLAVSVATSSRTTNRRAAVLELANSILNTLRFSSDAAASAARHEQLASLRLPLRRGALR